METIRFRHMKEFRFPYVQWVFVQYYRFLRLSKLRCDQGPGGVAEVLRAMLADCLIPIMISHLAMNGWELPPENEWNQYTDYDAASTYYLFTEHH